MTRIPMGRQSALAFKGRASSGAYNEYTHDTQLDLLELFEAANELEEELLALQETFRLNKEFQHRYIQKMQHHIRQLEDRIERRIEGERHHVHTVYANEMRHDPNVPVAERAFLDPVNEVAHLPLTTRTISKLYIVDALTRRISLPKALRARTAPSSRLGARIEENDPLHAVDGSGTTRWVRKVIMPIEESPDRGMTTQFTVSLPDTIISSRDVNMVTLKTFPVNSVRVDKVEFRVDGNWQLLPGWAKDEAGAPVPKEDAGSLKFCFANTPMTELRVTLSQFDWYEEKGEKVYHFGLQEVGVFHADFQSIIGKVDIPVALRGDAETKVLRSLTPLVTNASALSGNESEVSPVISYSIYTVDEDDQLHYTKDAFPVITTHSSVLIRAVIHADRFNGATPVLGAVELAYDNVY